MTPQNLFLLTDQMQQSWVQFFRSPEVESKWNKFRFCFFIDKKHKIKLFPFIVREQNDDKSLVNTEYSLKKSFH